MTSQLTNNELLASLSEKMKVTSDVLTKHAAEDAVNFGSINEKMEKLATKDDIKEVVAAFSDFVTFLKIFRTTSKWGYRTLLVVASIVVAIGAMGGGFKTIIGWFR